MYNIASELELRNVSNSAMVHTQVEPCPPAFSGYTLVGIALRTHHHQTHLLEHSHNVVQMRQQTHPLLFQ